MRTMQLAPRTSSVPAFIRLRLSERHNGVMKSSLSMVLKNVHMELICMKLGSLWPGRTWAKERLFRD